MCEGVNDDSLVGRIEMIEDVIRETAHSEDANLVPDILKTPRVV